jgi:ATP-dependent DNA helicase DinG
MTDTRSPADTSSLVLPAWFQELRPHQVDAIEQILAAYDDGAEAVFVDAPTGSGKTVIAEVVRQRLDTRGLYVCSDKALQRQFVRDFTEAALLQGRANYTTELNRAKTADDCTASSPQDSCDHCTSQSACPYNQAKFAALRSRLACVNSSYYLAATNHAGLFTGEPFVVLDEADTLENVLLGFIEYKVPGWAIARAGGVPVKGARKTTIVRWMTDTARNVEADTHTFAGTVDPKRLRQMQSFVIQTRYLITQLTKDIQAGADDDDLGKWLRVYDDDKPGLHLKPVLVAAHGPRYLWRHAKRFLLMSGTLISTDEMVDTLGMPLDHATVTVPMTFPIEHRPIVLAPVADMTRKATDADYIAMAYAIQQVANLHDSRILVHTVSRDRADRLVLELEKLGGVGRRPVITYRSSSERDSALDRYLAKPGSILFAQSMDRGVDLPGEACRVQVIAKIPFPSLGDRRTAARLHLPGGQDWYTVQAVRSIVQMTGRGVRSADDWATTYIFDAQFRNLWKQRSLFPAYWREAVDRGRDIRQFIQKN